MTLTGKQSKFCQALSKRLDPALWSKLEFDRAEISPDASAWDLFFYAGTLTDEETAALREAIGSIIPAHVSFTLTFLERQAEETVPSLSAYADEPAPESVPAPDDSDAPETPPERDEYESLAQDTGESAMDRYRKRMEELSRTEAERARSLPKPKKSSGGQAKGKILPGGAVLYGKPFEIKNVTPIAETEEFSRFVTLIGDVFSVNIREHKKGSGATLSFGLTDYTSSILCSHSFSSVEEAVTLAEAVKGHVAVQGSCQFDAYIGETTVRFSAIQEVKQAVKTDDAPKKRVEMHLHTKMSQMDGIVDLQELINLMTQYGHDTVAITDHGVVQAFPYLEDMIGKSKANIRLVFGTEGYLLDDDPPVKGLPDDALLSDLPCCVVCVRTAGTSVLNDPILEIGACRCKNGVPEAETFHTTVCPHRAIEAELLLEYNLTQEILDRSPEEDEAIRAFTAYAEGCVLIAHRAGSACSFLQASSGRAGIPYAPTAIDTLRLSREIVPNIKSGKFNKVCDALEIRTGEITDALKEAQITSVIWRKLSEILAQKGIADVGSLNRAMATDNGESYHIILYARNKTGLFNLYSLITESHLFHLRRKRPQIPRSSLIAHREGLLLASACEAGELYRALLRGANDQEAERIASFYDFLEIQPLGNNDFLVRDGYVPDRNALIELNKRIVALGEKLNKPVIATGDVHYLRPRDAIYRSIIQCAEGYPDADKQAPLYYRTTQEMLDEFFYLDEAKRREIVIDNPRMVADMCEKLDAFPRDHLYTPEMDHADEDLREMCTKRAHELYEFEGKLPEIVEKRLEKELTAIIKNRYAVLYLIAHKVVKKSLSDGYLVGSRGSVGSSFAATMADITEVNPLQPHYRCPACRYSDFSEELAMQYDCGVDMPRKACPHCGTDMERLGFTIPFEVFMGFDGDKVPDIDLNFSGVYQPVVHKYIEELFGEQNVFRAGTITGVADKTAIGYVKGYCETYGLGRPRKVELERMAGGCVDVKKSTGQHAGGVVILPKEYNINQFTPLQYPSNDPSKGVITTHFTFESLHDTLLKEDILGHDDPTMMRMLEDLTGLNVRRDVPLDDPKVMSLFLNTDALGVTPEDIGCKTGTYGIPELGTPFTLKMLDQTKPKTFSELVKISGLSHGTNVWNGNAQDLIASGKLTLSQCICTREDIMNNLLRQGVANFTAFDTMEKVRKGKGVPEKYLEEIRSHDVPEWFIESCNKIKYMFPKAHAAAYVTTAMRNAWFKLYYPHEFYATYFTVRSDDFEVGFARMKKDELKKKIAEYREKKPDARDKRIQVILEMALEMKARGIEFTDIDIYESKATDFTITKDRLIRPPLVAVPGLGETAAESIVAAREDEKFKSQDDLLSRTKLSSTLLQALADCGCLKDLPRSQQISLFDL